jgi:hypothetical protein
MARDPGLEQLLGEDLGSLVGVSEKPMFGGWAWLINGKMFCAARADGMLARVGEANSCWALSHPGVVPMISRGKPMRGWVRLDPVAYGDDVFRREVLAVSVSFTRSLSSRY